MNVNHEGNTSWHQVGWLYLCDLNPKDHLELQMRAEGEEVQYILSEIDSHYHSGKEMPDKSMRDQCLDSNLR